MLGKIYLSSANHHESVLTGEKKGVLGAKYHSFEKKAVDDSSKDRQVFEVAVVFEISVASKAGESFSRTQAINMTNIMYFFESSSKEATLIAPTSPL